jgi:hypothetical protein
MHPRDAREIGGPGAADHQSFSSLKVERNGFAG